MRRTPDRATTAPQHRGGVTITSGNSQQTLLARLAEHVQRATRLGHGRNDSFLTWMPARPATPRVCVVSFATPNLLRPGSWGAPAVEQSLNWALAHGYSYHALSHHVLPSDVPKTWSKIWAAWLATQRRDWRCSFVMFLDADAVVHAVSSSLSPLLQLYFGDAALGVHLLLSTHENRSAAGGGANSEGASSQSSSSTEGGTALGCHCARARSTCAAQDIAATTVARGGVPNRCVINTGVFLLRNSEAGHRHAGLQTTAAHASSPHRTMTSPRPPPSPMPRTPLPLPRTPVPRTSPPRRREALRYWRDGADGLCKLATREETVEQRCVRHVKTRWPRRVDVVHSRVFNSLYLQYTSAVPPSTAEAGCFGDGGEGRHLVCHMMGMPPPLRLAVFGRERDARRAELRGLLAQRAERYVSLSGDG